MGVYDGSYVNIDQSSFKENAAHIVVPNDDMNNYYKLGIGGAMYIEHSRVDISTSSVTDSMAVMDGGECGVHCD